MSNEDLHIDESSHEPVLNTTDRIKHSLFALLLGFLLINIIGFWMFPGIGIGGFYMFSSAHSVVSFIGGLTNVIMAAFLAICGVVGWFQGKYFTDRLKSYISWWKFW